jgi:hypothetical protein
MGRPEARGMQERNLGAAKTLSQDFFTARLADLIVEGLKK